MNRALLTAGRGFKPTVSCSIVAEDPGQPKDGSSASLEDGHSARPDLTFEQQAGNSYDFGISDNSEKIEENEYFELLNKKRELLDRKRKQEKSIELQKLKLEVEQLEHEERQREKVLQSGSSGDLAPGASVSATKLQDLRAMKDLDAEAEKFLHDLENATTSSDDDDDDEKGKSRSKKKLKSGLRKKTN